MGRLLTQVLVLFNGGFAFAQVPRVAVMHEPRQDEAARRMRAEVSAAGFDALDLVVSSVDPRSTAKLAFDAHALAALRIGSNGNVELLVIDDNTGEVRASAAFSGSGSSGEPSLRAVEDLRAKLIELSVVPKSARESPATTAHPQSGDGNPAAPTAAGPPRAPASERPRALARSRERSAAAARDQRAGLWLQAGLGGAVSAGGLAANPTSHFGLRFEPTASWSVSALALIPLAAQRVSNDHGRAEVEVRLFGADFGWVPIRARTLDLELGLGAAAAATSVRGFPATAMDQGRSETVWSGCGFAVFGAAWRPLSWIRVRAAMLAGSTAPRPTVHFNSETVATWGRPFAVGTLGVEVAPLPAASDPL